MMLHHRNITFSVLTSLHGMAVDTTKWLQTPSGEVTQVDGNSLDESGWFPLPNIAGIACKCAIETE